MSRDKSKKILFAGIGNVLKSDDGIGVYISNRIMGASHVLSLTVETGIENYIGKINSLNPDLLILIDCVDFGREPGYCSLLPVEKTRDFTIHTHNISLNKISELFDMPVHILGIQPQNLSFGKNLSERIKETADRIIEIINGVQQ
ncbi:MAG: hydrogenase maturation protease [Candidatus Aerophobus sp.]|nr:MAG: hydrogenase maturation protease [Candidatus Aerophobus sp.]